ncbi:MAG: preprotein translocase subunit SecE [Ktedonobacterales bacterium]
MAKTVGKGKGSTLRGRVSAEPETELVDSSSDEPRDEELVGDEEFMAPEEDEPPEDTADEIGSGNSALVPSDIPAEIRHVEGRPRTVHIPEWMMGNIVTRYAAESFVELYSNTTWPTWREAWNFTLIVIAMSTVIAIILGVADLGLAHVLTWFVGLGK